MEPANCKFVIFPGAVGFEVVLGMLRVLRVLRVLGVATVLLFDEPCGVVLRLMDSANCELVILPGAVGFEVVSGVLRVLGMLGVVTALLFDERFGVEKSCRVVALEVARA